MAERQGALSTVSSGRLASHTGDILQDYFSPREYGHYSLAWFSVCRNAFRRILRRSAQAEKEINNTIIYPVLSLYPARMDIEKEGWFQMARKISPDIPVRAVTLTPAQAEYLITGKILPTALFRVPLSPW